MPEHPAFPAGYNSTDNDGDDVDGAGINWPVWPVLFDSFIGYHQLIITQEMLDAFLECPDFVAPHDYDDVSISPQIDVIVFPGEDDTAVIEADGWGTLTIAPELYTLVVPPETSSMTVTEEGAQYEASDR